MTQDMNPSPSDGRKPYITSKAAAIFISGGCAYDRIKMGLTGNSNNYLQEGKEYEEENMGTFTGHTGIGNRCNHSGDIETKCWKREYGRTKGSGSYSRRK